MKVMYKNCRFLKFNKIEVKKIQIWVKVKFWVGEGCETIEGAYDSLCH